MNSGVHSGFNAGSEWPEGGGETGALIRSFDWSATSLGPLAGWPASLRAATDIVLRSPAPMAILWGADGVMLYNGGYAQIAGRRHPQLLGSKVREGWPEVAEFSDHVMKVVLAGEALSYHDQPLLLHRGDAPEKVWLNLHYSPLLDGARRPAGVLAVVAETTDRVQAERALRDERDRGRNVLDSMGEAFILLDHDFRVVRMNAEAMRLEGRPALDIIGRSHWEVWPGTETSAIGKLYKRAMRDRGSVALEHRYTWPGGREGWFEVRGYPSSEGLALFYREVTQRRRIQDALRESEDHYRHIVELNPQVVWTARPDGQLDRVSERWFEWTGTTGLGSSWGEAVHPDDLGPSVEAWLRALATGLPYDIEHRVRLTGGEHHWMHSRAYPRRDDEGQIVRWYGSTADIHEQKTAEAALAASELRLRGITDSVDQMIWSTRPDGYHDYYNARWYEYTGMPEHSTDGEEWNGMFHPEDQDRAWARWRHSLATGETYEIEYRLRHRSGRYRWVLGRAQPVRGGDGRIVRWYGTCTDVHDQKLAEEELRESRDRLARESHALEVLNRTGTQVAAELGLENLVQKVVDAGVELTGARMGAFFYNVPDAGGARYMLFALSGAERGAFEALGMPRATKVFAPTFRGEGVIRSADILADERYGRNDPHAGLPAGHAPVRSYLAAPVISRSGEVIGGMLFGHPQPGMFAERSERLVTGLAAQAAIGIDNARLFEAVQAANAGLEQRVAERTAELEHAHEALRQAQKMEAVGQLTGGIAHDFNNMLAVVIGSLDLLGRRLRADDLRARRYVDAAVDGARRAALLTQRLLAFSRQQPLSPEAIDANKLVSGMSDLLRHSLGSDVRLETVLAGGLWRTHADPNQLESVILNLAVNARDAMPGGGRLTIETQNAHLDDRYAAGHPGVAAGQYVLLAIADTGTGMTPEVIARAFDPFYTTKEVGRGTGLGLSQVYGFVKQSGGHVKIDSEPGQGTTLKVYLPRLAAPDVAEAKLEPAVATPLGERHECVLVVEDEGTVRQFSVDALSELGYRVLEADGAAAALRLLAAHPEIALLFTDVVMPDVNGRKLADEARRQRPELRVLFTTGYSRNTVMHDGVLDAGVHLLGKPFTLDELAAKVREVLDAPRPGGDG